MYCCCDAKIGKDGEWKCNCDWEGWKSCCDFPVERKNKNIPICDPPIDGTYLVRRQNGSADRYEEESQFSFLPKIVPCGYTGKLHQINWSGDEDHQPYAWKELDMGRK